ncbi:MAG: hypothetical protein S4CHLAM7_13590 [Chlamydiae bacterium]|nr:hypothetical protein [Chlamydiota bacterium]
MSVQKFFLTVTLGLFAFIGILGWVKKGKDKAHLPATQNAVQEVAFNEKNNPIPLDAEILHAPIVAKNDKPQKTALPTDVDLPTANYIESFFDPAALKLPIVETIQYSSRVPWLKGKPAWVSDYASHYKTSKHFIARSLNSKPDYLSQNVKHGDRFNVLRMDKDFYFYLLVDVSRCKMWFYYVDNDTEERVLVKTYHVGLGRPDEMKGSGNLTPIGKYTLGEKIAVYRPGIMGFHNNQSVEMVRIFGSRWIPFEKEIEGCTAPAKGLGLHGNPLQYDNQTGKWKEDCSGVGQYTSDGCLRLSQSDMEELFSIIVSRPAVVELVKDFHNAELPGKEKHLN